LSCHAPEQYLLNKKHFKEEIKHRCNDKNGRNPQRRKSSFKPKLCRHITYMERKRYSVHVFPDSKLLKRIDSSIQDNTQKQNACKWVFFRYKALARP
jgi:hypothetical protein